MRRIVAMFLVAVFLCGCISQPGSETATPTTNACMSAPCPGTGPASNQTSSQYEGAGCNLIQPLFRTTTQVFAPDYPAGVKGFNSELVSGGLRVYACKQLVWPGHVAKEFQLALFLTLITPMKNVDENHTNMFAHQAYSNNPDFVASVSNQSDWPIRLIPSIAIKLDPLPTGYQTASFSIPETSPDYDFRGTVDVQGDAPIHNTEAYVFANSQNRAAKFLKVEYQGQDNSASPGTLSFGPGSYFAKHSKSPSLQVTTIHDTELTLRMELLPIGQNTS